MQAKKIYTNAELTAQEFDNGVGEQSATIKLKDRFFCYRPMDYQYSDFTFSGAHYFINFSNNYPNQLCNADLLDYSRKFDKSGLKRLCVSISYEILTGGSTTGNIKISPMVNCSSPSYSNSILTQARQWLNIGSMNKTVEAYGTVIDEPQQIYFEVNMEEFTNTFALTATDLEIGLFLDNGTANFTCNLYNVRVCIWGE